MKLLGVCERSSVNGLIGKIRSNRRLIVVPHYWRVALRACIVRGVSPREAIPRTRVVGSSMGVIQENALLLPLPFSRYRKPVGKILCHMAPLRLINQGTDACLTF